MAKMPTRLTKLLIRRSPGARWDGLSPGWVEAGVGGARRPDVRSTLCLRHRPGGPSRSPFPRRPYEEGRP